MNTKHTPGPWKIEYDNDGSPRAIVPSGARTTVLCNCPGCATFIERDYHEIVTTDSHVYGPTLQDALLIAAAPDLLDVLSRFADFPFAHQGPAEGPLAVMIRQARAAIAKAEGR